MGSPPADKSLDRTLEEFTAIWETLALEKSAPFDAELTQTMRPRTRLSQVNVEALLGELPRLTTGDTRVEFAEISLGGVIGEGGMGRVSLAHQRSVARQVAVKSLLAEAHTPENTLVLLREGWITGRLEHPNIPPVYTLGRGDAGEPIIVMKKIAGVSLADLLEDPEKSPRDLGTKHPLDFYLEILAQVCNAVHYAHSKGILHRDIKPENIMLGEFGEVYLLDWGIAVSLHATSQGRLPLASEVTSPAGTPAYMAPEMVTGGGAGLSEKTDVYLLGAVLHEMLTGAPPHSGTSLFQVMFNAYHAQPKDYGPEIHPELAAICRRAMHPQAAERFESADALRYALEVHLSHRNSLRISERSRKRLIELRQMLEAEEKSAPAQAVGGAPADDLQIVSEHEVYRIFGACRFGFEQALEINPENEEARRGLQEAIELLAGREIRRGAYRAAALLIADLPRPNSELKAQLARLNQQLASRDREFEALKRGEFEQDIAVGRYSRSLYTAAIGVLWGGLAVAWEPLAAWAEIEVTPQTLLFHAVFVLGMALIPAFLFRRVLMQNAINRKIIYSAFAAVAGGFLLRIVGILLQLPVETVIITEMTMHATVGLVVAIFADIRLLWLAGALTVGALSAALLPGHATLCFGLSLMAGMFSTALAWRKADACL